MKHVYAIVLFFFLSPAAFALQNKIDSLKQLLRDTKEERQQVSILYELAAQHGKAADRIAYRNQACALAEKVGDQHGIVTCLELKGIEARDSAHYSMALNYLLQAIALAELIEDKEQIARLATDIGSVYRRMDQYDRALEYFMRALSLSEDVEDVSVMTHALNGIGNTYRMLRKDREALNYFERALKMETRREDKTGMAINLNNIGKVYYNMSEYDKALSYLEQSLRINRELQNRRGVAVCLNTMGNVYRRQGKYDKAVVTLLLALSLDENLGDKRYIIDSNLSVGEVYAEMGNYRKAFAHIERGIDLALKVDIKSKVQFGYERLSALQAQMGDYQQGLKSYQTAMVYKDSILNEENNRSIIRLQTRFEVEKREAQIKLLQKDKEVQATEIRHQRITSMALGGGLCLIMMLAFVLYRNNVQKHRANELLSLQNEKINKQNEAILLINETLRRQKKEIQTQRDNIEIQNVELQKQKEEIMIKNEELKQQKEEIQAQRDNIEAQNFVLQAQAEEIMMKNDELREQQTEIQIKNLELADKNQSITDSLNYARRIQTAMLPYRETIAQVFPEHFVLFKPKDIVSGDFYWFSERNGKAIIAAVDCTGHGVPGAFMSMIGDSMLNHLVNDRGITQPDLVLNEMHRGIRKALKQEGGDNRDGMDMALCVIDKSTNTLEYAGAGNPLYLVQPGENGEPAFREVKADRHPIGGYQSEVERIFTCHTIDISVPTTFYIFSDGYQDQFGGTEETKGRKFMVKRFRELLFNIHHQPVEEQRRILDETIENWIGVGNKQIDDILVMGVKIG